MAISRELPHSFGEALRVARELLSRNLDLVAKNLVETEAELLVAAAYRSASGKQLSRVELFTRREDRYPERAGEALIVMAGARSEGKILQHLTGVQVFLDHEYEVGPDVLVPRPETEVLARHAIETLRSATLPSLGLEVGLGSGVLSIELLSAFPGLRVIASELTQEAEARALKNAGRILGASAARRLEVARAQSPLEVLEPLERALAGRQADFLVSNPPYLTRRDPIEADVACHEPETALYAPETDPLHFFRAVARGSEGFFKPGAWVFMELAPERAEAVLRLFAAPAWESALVNDLTGRARVLRARRK